MDQRPDGPPSELGSSSTRVLAEAMHGAYAAVLIDRGEGPRLELLTPNEDGAWRIRALGDAEAVSDGAVMAVWDETSQRIVFGRVTEQRDGAPLEPLASPGPSRDLALMWLAIQGVAFWPAAAGAYVWEATGAGIFLGSFQVLIALVIGFLIARNLVRLWRDPSREPGRAYALAALVIGALLLVFCRGPLLDGRLATVPLGAMWLLLGVNLLALAAREAFRLRTRRAAAVR